MDLEWCLTAAVGLSKPNELWIFCCQMGKMNEAIDDCTKAIELDEKYVKAYLRRAKWYVTR